MMDETEDDVLPVEARRGRLAVELDFLDDGVNGTYNPSDPNDVPLVHLDVNVDGAPIEEASAPTRIPANAPGEEMQAVAFRVLDQLHDTYAQKGGVTAADVQPFIRADRQNWQLPALTERYFTEHLRACAHSLLATRGKDANGQEAANIEAVKALHRALEECHARGAGDPDLVAAGDKVELNGDVMSMMQACEMPVTGLDSLANALRAAPEPELKTAGLG